MTLDIEDAFTQEAIAAAGVDVGGEDENEIREVIRKVSQSARWSWAGTRSPWRCCASLLAVPTRKATP